MQPGLDLEKKKKQGQEEEAKGGEDEEEEKEGEDPHLPLSPHQPLVSYHQGEVFPFLTTPKFCLGWRIHGGRGREVADP